MDSISPAPATKCSSAAHIESSLMSTKSIVFAALLFLSGASKYASAQIIVWHVLRPSTIDSTLWSYYSLSACDDHNFIVVANYDSAWSNHLCFLHTSDAGYTWQARDPQLARPLSDYEEYDLTVFQTDSLHAIAVSDSGVIIRTADGGATWTRNDYLTSHILSGVHFSDANTGIIVGGAVIITTSDGGATWRAVSNPPYAWMRSCHSYGKGKFRAFNLDQGLIHTTYDGWNTWDSLHIRASSDTATGYRGIVGCEFIGQDSILAYGSMVVGTSQNTQRSRVLLSVDGGKSWVEQLDRFTYAWPSHFSASYAGLWVGGGGGNGEGTLYSTDRGLTWIDDSATLSLPPLWTKQGMDAVQVVSPTRAIGIFNGDIVDLNLSTLSVEQYEREIYGTHVYPNPASGFVNIQSTVGSTPIVLVDPLGREPIVAQLNPDGTLHIDISKLRNGVYQVNMFYNGTFLHITNLVVLPQ
jgi:photosystem II stability/assembly factor-like uncharacterized protein